MHIDKKETQQDFYEYSKINNNISHTNIIHKQYMYIRVVNKIKYWNKKIRV